MNSLDLIILGVLALFVFLGARRGFMDEILGISGWIIAVVCAIKFGGTLALMITEKVPQLHMISSVLAGLILLFGIRYMFLFLIKIIKKAFPTLTENIFNKIIGSVLGFVQGLIIISILVLLLWIVPFGKNVQNIRNQSIFLPHMENVTSFLLNSVANFVPYAQPVIENLNDKIHGFDSQGLSPDDLAPIQDRVKNISDNPPIDKKTQQELKKKVQKLDKELRR